MLELVRSHRRAARRGEALAVCALTLALVVLAGCSQASARSAASPTPTATATQTPAPTATPSEVPTPTLTAIKASGPPVPGTSPSWHTSTLPQGFGPVFHISSLDIAASDGLTAYTCGAPSNNGAAYPQVLATHDGAHSWHRMADIPAAWGSCATLAVDMLDPYFVAAASDIGPTENNAISLDGGQTWRLATGQQWYLVEKMATRNGRTYAILYVNNPTGYGSTLVASNDHLRTWRAIDGSLTSGGDPTYGQMWVNPATGAILAETWPHGGALGLWSTTDEGQHWTQLRWPAAGVVDFRVQQPEAAGPWHVCAEYYASTSDSNGAFACTKDGGQTWTQLPDLIPNGSYSLFTFGLPRDGSVLAYDNSSTSTLYRWQGGATRWQSLGTMPGLLDYPLFAPTASGGEIWMVASESDGAGGTGTPNIVYTAAIGG